MIQHFAARHFAADHFAAIYHPVEEVVAPPVAGGGGGAYYDEGYFRRRREDEEKRRKRRKQLADDLARAIDRAVARVLGEDEPQPVATPPLAAVDDGLDAIRERLATLEALGDRLGQADAGLEALRRRALALIEQARLDDDDEAIELLLMVM